MEIKRFKIAGGNATALVYNCPEEIRTKTAMNLRKDINKVEQVGFVEKNEFPEMNMSGSELCINATLAFASTLGEEGKLSTSGLNSRVSYWNNPEETILKISCDYQKKEDNIILLDGIGFIIRNKSEENNNYNTIKEELNELCKKYKLNAFGQVFFEDNIITPHVLVIGNGDESFEKETACGSGSIAFSLYSGCKEVIQPTGKIIRVVETGGFVEVSSTVTQYF